MSKDYTVRPYRPGDEEGIVELLELVFDGWPHLDLGCTSLEHWRWKYSDNPLDLTLISLGIDEDGVIGCEHLVPLRVKICDETVLSTIDVDVAVHPDYRRIGVSRRIGEASDTSKMEADVRFAYAITGNPILVRSLAKRYPRFPHQIVNLVRINDIDLHLHEMPVEREWLMRLGFQMARLLNNAKNTLRGSEFNQDLHVSEIDSFDERIDCFWEEVADGYDFIVERRMSYLNWRYCDPRAGDFIVNQVEGEGSRILGYSVLRINRYLGDYPVGYIVDLLTLPDRLDVADALVKSALSFFQSNEVNIINYQTIKGHPYEAVLGKHGFLDSKIKLHLFYNPLGIRDEADKLEKSPVNRIHISWGDYDVLPVRMPDSTSS